MMTFALAHLSRYPCRRHGPMASNMGFEYENEESINRSLMCSICNQPFIQPVSTNCKKRHKFCRACIEPWLERNQSCPTCRQRLQTEDLISITEDIVVDVLNELLVQCSACGRKGIERGNFPEHVKMSCPMVVVPCSANDINCPWTGHRSLHDDHRRECSYEALRPVLAAMIKENQCLKKQVRQLNTDFSRCQNEMSQLREKIRQQASRLDAQHSEMVHLTSQLIRRGSLVGAVDNTHSK